LTQQAPHFSLAKQTAFNQFSPAMKTKAKPMPKPMPKPKGGKKSY